MHELYVPFNLVVAYPATTNGNDEGGGDDGLGEVHEQMRFFFPMLFMRATNVDIGVLWAPWLSQFRIPGQCQRAVDLVLADVEIQQHSATTRRQGSWSAIQTRTGETSHQSLKPKGYR